MVIDDSLVDFALANLNKLNPLKKKRGLLTSQCKLPCMKSVGIQINNPQLKETVVQDDCFSSDPFNIKYYRSDRRKKYSKMFGLDEAEFEQISQPLTMSIFKKIEIELSGITEQEQATYFVESKLRTIQPLLVLKACIPFEPEVAEQMISDILKKVEESIVSLIQR
jgi:hypothetical protein